MGSISGDRNIVGPGQRADRAPVVAFHVDRVVTGRCRHGRSLWERIIGSDLTRTALRVFQIVNFDQGDSRIIAFAANDHGIISRQQSRDHG